MIFFDECNVYWQRGKEGCCFGIVLSARCSICHYCCRDCTNVALFAMLSNFKFFVPYHWDESFRRFDH